ncbi:PEP-CTERM sorting domain-containing protein [Verrucomicrobiaceae bacterium N1E253]|uniref:PEP-CTERM sorting domain-containing protein n=1 Tax=Oceaniferula marina TaxID=2748318 RepID=A0A851GKP4_9BACT|nr:PEP-CTERM sorting domain-containing protein [Oceaniferula marina]NWK57709.1 PEP-CTERM sorting domain-containing protein [Oceaniferula marina]
MKTTRTLATLAATLITFGSFAGGANAAIAITSTPVATGGQAYFSDGGSSSGADYFGVVDNTGTMIAGSFFSPSDTTPPSGSIAGRDHDDGNNRPGTRTAEWQLNIGSISGASAPFTNIFFSGSIAAGPNGWDNDPGGSTDFVMFELLLDGVVVASETQGFRSTAPLGGFAGNLALDTNGDGVGDGAVVGSEVAQNFSLTGTTANSTVVLRMTAHSDASGAEFWANGTLTADVAIVPEPSVSFLIGAGALGFLARRKRTN